MYLNNKRFIKGMNKRGIVDLFFWTIILASLGVFIVVLGYVVDQVTDEFLASPMNTSSLAVDAFNYSNTIPAKFNFIWLTLFMGLTMGLLISAALIDVSKVFVPVYIILLGLDVLVGVIMNNVYEEFRTNADLSATAAQFSFTNAIMDHYVLVIIAVGILAMILYFGKTSSGGGQRI